MGDIISSRGNPAEVNDMDIIMWWPMAVPESDSWVVAWVWVAVGVAALGLLAFTIWDQFFA
jgi:hypothetical protein